jgi:hypothetical protein
VLSAAATSTNGNESISISGGDGSNADCVAKANLCVANGNEYRPTPAQVNAEVWMSLINGANGIEYFCNDMKSISFCLGDPHAGAEAAAVQANLAYVNSNVLRFAEALNAATVGQCSMQLFNYSTAAMSTATSCSNGILSMTTSNAAVPGMALVKSLRGVTHLIVQSDRRSPAGTTFNYTLAGLGGQRATVVYDSNTQYDPAHSSFWHQFTLNSQGQFSDTVGANGDDYEVKIYKIH